METRLRAGFTAIEELVVLAIIGCLMGLEMPAIQVHREITNQAAALDDAEAIAAAEALFRTNDSDGDTFDDYGSLAELGSTGLVDPDLADGVQDGYAFTVDLPAPPPPLFAARAIPLVPRTGGLRFYVDQTGVVRFTQSGTPGPGSPVLPPGDESTLVPDSLADWMLSRITSRWVQQIDALGGGGLVPQTIAFVRSHPLGTLAETAMDADGNRALGLGEPLGADLLDVARTVIAGLGLDPGVPVGNDDDLRPLLEGFQADLSAFYQLDLDAPQPEVAISDLPSDPSVVIETLRAAAASVPAIGPLAQGIAALLLATAAACVLRPRAGGPRPRAGGRA